jgi:hypothetical protein
VKFKSIESETDPLDYLLEAVPDVIESALAIVALAVDDVRNCEEESATSSAVGLKGSLNWC